MQHGDIDRSNELQIRIWLDGEHGEASQVDSTLRKNALEMNRIPVAQNTFFISDMQPANPLDPPAITRLEAVNCPTLIVTGSLDHPKYYVRRMKWSIEFPMPEKRLSNPPGMFPVSNNLIRLSNC